MEAFSFTENTKHCHYHLFLMVGNLPLKTQINLTQHIQKHPRVGLNKTKIAFKGSPCFYAFQLPLVGSWEFHYKAGVFCLSRCKATSRKNYQPISTRYPVPTATPENFPSLYFTVTASQSLLPSLVQVCCFQCWQLELIKNYCLFSKKL